MFVCPQAPISGTSILKQLQENGIKAQIIVSETILSNNLIQENKNLFEGVYGAEPFLDETRGATKKFLEEYSAKYGKTPEFPTYQAAAYDQVFMLAQAFEEVGTKPAAVRDWLYQVKDWPGALGDITMDKNGDPAIGYHIKYVQSSIIKDVGSYQP